jgi:hypothetical protein
MGLDITCKEESERVGSYSYVHIQRLQWIKASIQYLENVKKEVSSRVILEDREYTSEELLNLYLSAPDSGEDYMKLKQIIDALSNLKKSIILVRKIKFDSSDFSDEEEERVNYSSLVNLLDILKNVNLAGLYWWSYLSDCEGKITPGQSLDILITLKQIYLHLDKDTFDNEDNISYKNYYLYRVFQESVDTLENITLH